MKPVNYTKTGNKITYHYTYSKLKEFLKHGFKEGNNGVILVGQDDRFLYYKGFGTIENPWRYVASISVENDPMFEGDMPKPENILKPPKRESIFENYGGMIIWDANKQNYETNN